MEYEICIVLCTTLELCKYIFSRCRTELLAMPILLWKKAGEWQSINNVSYLPIFSVKSGAIWTMLAYVSDNVSLWPPYQHHLYFVGFPLDGKGCASMDAWAKRWRRYAYVAYVTYHPLLLQRSRLLPCDRSLIPTGDTRVYVSTWHLIYQRSWLFSDRCRRVRCGSSRAQVFGPSSLYCG